MERVSLQFRRGTLSDSKFDKSTSTSTTASLNSTLDSRLSFHSFLEVLWISDGVLSLFCFSFALHTLLSALHNRGVSGFFGVIIIALADESMNTRADTNDIRTNGRMWRMSIDLSLLFLFTKPLSSLSLPPSLSHLFLSLVYIYISLSLCLCLRASNSSLYLKSIPTLCL